MKNIYMVVSVLFMILIAYVYKTNIEPIFVRINTLCIATDNIIETIVSDKTSPFLAEVLSYYLGITDPL